jgi:hypothetical protein
LQEKLEEFMNYITSNVTSIPNYSDRHRHGEPIAKSFRAGIASIRSQPFNMG